MGRGRGHYVLSNLGIVLFAQTGAGLDFLMGVDVHFDIFEINQLDILHWEEVHVLRQTGRGFILD
jgi:hypothetical protein